MVRRWRSWFLEGRQNVHGDERGGRPVIATDNAAVAAVRNVVEADRRVTIDDILIRMPPGIEIGRSSIGTIMSDGLNFRKVCARWVPRLLSENHKQQWMEVTISAGKVMAIVLWDCKGVLLVDCLPPNTTVNVARYCEVLTKLRAAIKRKRSRLLSRKVLLVHDNARPHAARTTQTLLENFKWEIFTHPPYSPELAPSDFHLFPALKFHLGGKHFANDDEVQAEANHWLRRQDTAWYNSGIKKLLQRYQKCLHRNAPVKTYLETLKWEILTHPPYSPDTAPSHYYLFRSIQHGLADQHFSNYDEVKKWIDEWIAAKEPAFFRDGIRQLSKRWGKNALLLLTITFKDGKAGDRAESFCLQRQALPVSMIVKINAERDTVYKTPAFPVAMIAMINAERDIVYKTEALLVAMIVKINAERDTVHKTPALPVAMIVKINAERDIVYKTAALLLAMIIKINAERDTVYKHQHSSWR
ncbi:hypothetical protein LAZ67_19001988 [Cordylochernes scorpioides]|uniref:Transposase n=1 Tax=Cordylochernes scorpioides TaxID=51811 RepID=A0ABY6LKZ8_9ARAC|nr:hypothetical protein LAZ67_19001988 [Cordylochernes scorpioides]